MGVYPMLLLAYILTVGRCVSGDIGYGLCSEVYQMHQYCTQASSDVVSLSPEDVGVAVGGRVGKQGPRGFPGPAGTVNYTLIDENVKEMFQEAEQRIDATLVKYEKILNETQDKISNAVVKIEETESKMEAKLAEYEDFLNEKLQPKINEIYPTDCGDASHDHAKIRDANGGVFDIYPKSRRNNVEVYCELTTDGGRWTVFQRRIDGSVDFVERDYNDYVNGFGYSNEELWLGLEKIYQLTKDGEYELRVDLGDWEGNTAFAKYGLFSVASSSDDYRLTVGEYSGDAGDSMNGNNGMSFSTKNRDQDTWSGNCGEVAKGGWWYSDCGYSRPNGLYYKGGKFVSYHGNGIVWYHWKNDWKYSFKFIEMKFRKKIQD